MKRLMEAVIESHKHVPAQAGMAWQSRRSRVCRIIIVAALALTVTSCAMFHAKQRPQATTAIVTTNYTPGPFKTLMVEGSVRVELANGPYGIKITGIKEAVGYENINRVSKQTLSIKGTENTKTIKVTAPELRKIIVRNNASLVAEKFLSNKLIIGAYDNGRINLEGRFAIDRIFQRGHGSINIGWIDSDKILLDIHGSGPVYLFGKVNKMIARLFNNAQVNARYLRAKKAAVFTVDYSQMDVMALDSLEAFAIDYSNIYYYKRPEHLAVVTRDSGSALQPDWME